MKKPLLLIIAFIFISGYTSAQKITRDLISPQGDFNSIANITLEWTLGDSFTGTNTTLSNIFTQGFNQSRQESNPLSNVTILNDYTKSIIYPNPVNSVLNIKIGEGFDTEIKVALFDFSGRYIAKYLKRTNDYRTTIHVRNLQSGIYFIKISNLDGSRVETHKMVKH